MHAYGWARAPKPAMPPGPPVHPGLMPRGEGWRRGVGQGRPAHPGLGMAAGGLTGTASTRGLGYGTDRTEWVPTRRQTMWGCPGRTGVPYFHVARPGLPAPMDQESSYTPGAVRTRRTRSPGRNRPPVRRSSTKASTAWRQRRRCSGGEAVVVGGEAVQSLVHGHGVLRAARRSPRRVPRAVGVSLGLRRGLPVHRPYRPDLVTSDGRLFAQQPGQARPVVIAARPGLRPRPR